MKRSDLGTGRRVVTLLFGLLGIGTASAFPGRIVAAALASTVAAKLAFAAPFEDSPFGMLIPEVDADAYPDRGYYDAVNIGVRWNRGTPYVYWPEVEPTLTTPPTYDFSALDARVAAVPPSIHKLGNLFVNSFFVSRRISGSYLPIDQDRYTAFVRATVERYDGDGVADMPGLTEPVRYWQVDNEPDARFLADFDDLQRITYQAIKQADPASVVLLAGATAGGPVESSNGWISAFNLRFKPIIDALAGQYVDAVDIHWFGFSDTNYRMRDPSVSTTDVPGHVRSVLTNAGFPASVPLWSTEMGSPSGWPLGAPRTEAQQAQDYVKRFVFPLSHGIRKVFPAFGMMDGFFFTDGYFDHTGFIYKGLFSNDLGFGVRKLSYYAYKKLTEKLEGADWSTIVTLRDGTATDHLYLVQVRRAGVPVRVAWWDYFEDPLFTPGAAKTISFDGTTANPITVTELVPRVSTGSEVRDYSSAFTTFTVQTAGGVAEVPLRENPVVIEEVPVSPPPIEPEPQLPYPGPGRPVVPGSIEAENFDTDAPGIAYVDTTPGNSGGAYRTGVDVDIYPDPGASNGFAVVMSKNEWLEYSISVRASGLYTLTARVFSPYVSSNLAYWVDHLSATGLVDVPANPTGYQDVVADNVYLEAGDRILKLSTGLGGFIIDKVDITPHAVQAVQMEGGTVPVADQWTTVNLIGTYTQPVIVATVNYLHNTKPVVVRLRNTAAGSFEMKLQNVGGGVTPVADIVHYVVCEEGRWLLPDGRKLEAQRLPSDGTNENGSWAKNRMESYAFLHTYSAPVFLGQVMSTNDPRWSTFWTRDGRAGSPPGLTEAWVGKHVGEDPVVARATETLGVIVVETGSGVAAGVPYEAFVGPDSVRGIGNRPPYNYGLSAFVNSPAVAIVTQAGMQDGNGSWAYLFGTNALKPQQLALAVDEDELGDIERAHGSERLGAFVWGSPFAFALTPQ